jgi:LmbE family N-acetylglucosaminyl deacetylase
MNILAIGSHPDDIELGCGGTLMKAAKQGHNVFLYVLTRGNKSGDPLERTNEVIESAKFMGAKTAWIDNFEDTNVRVGSRLVNHLEYFVAQADPDVIFTHASNDYHHDHRAVAECTLEAARNYQNVLAYEIPVTKDFTPQLYYDISDVIEDKVRLIELFWSQRGKIFTKINAVRGMAEYRALQSRLNTTITHVESFQVLKMCVNVDFKPMKLQHKGLPTSVLEEMTKDLVDVIEYKRMSDQLESQRTIANKIDKSQYNPLSKIMEIEAPAEKMHSSNIVTSHSPYDRLSRSKSGSFE